MRHARTNEAINTAIWDEQANAVEKSSLDYGRTHEPVKTSWTDKIHPRVDRPPLPSRHLTTGKDLMELLAEARRRPCRVELPRLAVLLSAFATPIPVLLPVVVRLMAT